MSHKSALEVKLHNMMNVHHNESALHKTVSRVGILLLWLCLSRQRAGGIVSPMVVRRVLGRQVLGLRDRVCGRSDLRVDGRRLRDLDVLLFLWLCLLISWLVYCFEGVGKMAVG